MEDFKLIIDKCIELLSIEIPFLGHEFTLMFIFLALSAFSIAVTFMIKFFLR